MIPGGTAYGAAPLGGNTPQNIVIVYLKRAFYTLHVTLKVIKDFFI